MEKVTPGARGNPPLWAVTEKKTERSASTRIRCHHFLTLLSSSFFLLSLSSLPQLSGPGRAGVGDVQSCAASRGRLPSSRHSALSLSLALPLSQRKPLCDSSQRTLSEPNTASPAPGGERERELGWKGNEGRGQHGKRSEETPPNKE